MTERLTIADLAHRGDGVAETPAGPVYVPYTLPGETVEVERVVGHPDRRHLLHVVTESSERISPICPHFGVCGGCSLQHAGLALQVAAKQRVLEEALQRLGTVAPGRLLPPVVGPAWGYRYRAR